MLQPEQRQNAIDGQREQAIHFAARVDGLRQAEVADEAGQAQRRDKEAALGIEALSQAQMTRHVHPPSGADRDSALLSTGHRALAARLARTPVPDMLGGVSRSAVAGVVLPRRGWRIG